MYPTRDTCTQKKDTCIRKETHVKETYVTDKWPMYTIRDPYIRGKTLVKKTLVNETHVSDNRPVCTKRDQSIGKEPHVEDTHVKKRMMHTKRDS